MALRPRYWKGVYIPRGVCRVKAGWHMYFQKAPDERLCRYYGDEKHGSPELSLQAAIEAKRLVDAAQDIAVLDAPPWWAAMNKAFGIHAPKRVED